MNRLSKDDLAQMNRNYFQSLEKEKLVEVAGNLHGFAVEQLERLEQNSSNVYALSTPYNGGKNWFSRLLAALTWVSSCH